MNTVCTHSPWCEENQVCRCESWAEYEAIEKMLKGIVTDEHEHAAVIDCVMNLVVPYIKQNIKK